MIKFPWSLTFIAFYLKDPTYFWLRFLHSNSKSMLSSAAMPETETLHYFQIISIGLLSLNTWILCHKIYSEQVFHYTNFFFPTKSLFVFRMVVDFLILLNRNRCLLARRSCHLFHLILSLCLIILKLK